ncbi:bacterio-opsin activator HTH domain-containing protein [Natrialba chahannaoensis JCM 10990]|uniref:Bacterio-opsin activator HTH domain-containing protein n=1 Tax=Natrialba chahannaoensis JCM 10990 TaxID=1227492 RepID=M0ARH3_9EURY|nr:helix-turn-helix domain-containing protein [Natrialba chahannaoensis]ELZ01140.1 bacterio-opsin activator HTH domain-containing protein [Natrialba chahannaoensis JCM 10990]
MSVIATVAVPATAFPLGSVLDTAGADDATVTIETTIPTSEGVIPYLWVPVDVADAIVTTLESRSMVSGVSVIDEFDGTALIEIEWATTVNGILASIQESDALVTNAMGTADQWTFRLRFPSYDSLSAFYTACVDREIPIELLQLHEAVGASDDQRFGLTTAQRELIVAAYESGYFDVPRGTTLVELGHELGISDSAVSQRLRRGLSTLIGSTLAIDPHHTEDGDADSGYSSMAAANADTAVDGDRMQRMPSDEGDADQYEYEYTDESTPAAEGEDVADETESDTADGRGGEGPELQSNGANGSNTSNE